MKYLLTIPVERFISNSNQILISLKLNFQAAKNRKTFLQSFALLKKAITRNKKYFIATEMKENSRFVILTLLYLRGKLHRDFGVDFRCCKTKKGRQGDVNKAEERK